MEGNKLYVYTKNKNEFTWYEISKALKKHENPQLLLNYQMKDASDVFDDITGIHPKIYLTPFRIRDDQLIIYLNNQIKKN